MKRIVMCANNAAAIKAILNTQAHPGQKLSICFCQAVSEYLKADKKNTVGNIGHRAIKAYIETNLQTKKPKQQLVKSLRTYSKHPMHSCAVQQKKKPC
jgi:hypothetical protein